MLQQTQVVTVIPYYRRFIARFPGIAALAGANEDDVLAQWSGLGYYARARSLHRAARLVMAEYGGEFPRDFAAIVSLPGIGRTTAAAIAVFAFGDSRAILDGNVKRVLCRFFAMEGFPGDIGESLWCKAESLVPPNKVEAYTQAVMDLGATICTRLQPECGCCPLNQECAAFNSGRTKELPWPKARTEGRERQTRWLILLSKNCVWLEKRASMGVWGGLWCFPELPPHEDPGAFCANRFGIASARNGAIAPFTHAFTHFTLSVTPIVLEVEKRRLGAEEPGRRWLDISEAMHAAVPSPVRRILRAVQAAN